MKVLEELERPSVYWKRVEMDLKTQKRLKKLSESEHERMYVLTINKHDWIIINNGSKDFL